MAQEERLRTASLLLQDCCDNTGAGNDLDRLNDDGQRTVAKSNSEFALCGGCGEEYAESAVFHDAGDKRQRLLLIDPSNTHRLARLGHAESDDANLIARLVEVRMHELRFVGWVHKKGSAT